jgi:hypothetical protein
MPVEDRCHLPRFEAIIPANPDPCIIWQPFLQVVSHREEKLLPTEYVR